MLLTNQNISGNIVLVLGDGGRIVQARVNRLLECGAMPVLFSQPPTNTGNWKSIERSFQIEDLKSLGRPEVDHVVDAVFVVTSPITEQIHAACVKLRIPINVVDCPHLCTFTLPSTYHDGPFQVGISTAGTGCKLANRIKRQVVKSLPRNVGAICSNIGALREEIRRRSIELKRDQFEECGEHEDDSEQPADFNSFINEGDRDERKWLSQMVEYYPLEKLATVKLDEAELEAKIIDDEPVTESAEKSPTSSQKQGKISLVGAGPGSEQLLTIAAINEINGADIILADKLVPEEVLALVPRRTEIFIAKKFPGNAARAQEELLERGLASLQKGHHVVRLKQGDPYIFGRGAEEYLWFREQGYVPTVVPGITSALSAPAAALIPATHRLAADQLLMCTGTGTKGVLPPPPEFVKTRTTVFLMALHRIKDIVDSLAGNKWPLDLPCAVVERANCPDQRVIRTTLGNVAEAIEVLGSRPPGLLITGHSCDILKSMPEEKWTVEEGAQ